MITAHTLTATITVADTNTDTLVKMLPCDPGCHGVQFGAKQGGGYYAYVSSKFSKGIHFHRGLSAGVLQCFSSLTFSSWQLVEEEYENLARRHDQVSRW
jgi:hypothetical protein